ncbi:MAG TPA: (2Fe-2S)-binding protein [Bryobacteraceae bacterium]|jgi:sarcosine oxidase subunit alpha|nr:(2Fe-2S)-binding protein [Bryobacteraceae bacterium]
MRSHIERFTLLINGDPVEVAVGTSVAAALLCSGINVFRTSVSGEPRGPVCGMGICFECRVTINGRPNRRSCQVLCEPGMQVNTSQE